MKQWEIFLLCSFHDKHTFFTKFFSALESLPFLVLGADGDSTDEENLEDSDQVWTPRSYEKYKEMMLKELGDDYKDDF